MSIASLWHKMMQLFFICNAHDFYPEHECGRYKTLEEAKENSELKKYGGRIESTTYGELSNIYF